MLRTFGRVLLGIIYAAVPIVGWYLLFKSFKRVRSYELAVLQEFSGKASILDEGIYFRPFPGDQFSPTFSKLEDYIDFGPLKRVRVKEGQLAYKTDVKGQLVELLPGVHIIDGAKNEGFDPGTSIKSNQDDYIDFGAKKLIRIRDGQLGVKTNASGNYVELKPGVHTIDAASGETFDRDSGVRNEGEEDFILGNIRHVTIRNGELGESYRDGIFCLLEAGRHRLSPTHRFVKKVSVGTDVIDLGALKIVTVKEGQVAVINTPDGVVVKNPGKHDIKQAEGNFFNAIITTSQQGVVLPELTVMCSDQIEMRAESMLMYRVDEPLKTVGLGIDVIVGFLKTYADGTLRTILSRFSSSDIAPSLHVDDNHDSSKRSEKLVKLHDECVKCLDEKAREWGLRVTDLQITQILPADDVYLSTIRGLGAQQSTAEANRRLAENKSLIAAIEAKAAESKVTAAEIERREALVRAKTAADTRKIESEAQAQQEITLAKAKATGIELIANAAKNADDATQQIRLIEAQANVLKQIPNPVFLQPGLGHTSRLTRDKSNGEFTFFTTDPKQSSLIDATIGLQQTTALVNAIKQG